jgi:hypothetical protein
LRARACNQRTFHAGCPPPLIHLLTIPGARLPVVAR